uniref:Peptidase_M13 domain-containing protein n=1 Tax=Ascaris lumbricoides TaxID=6252 RepID=A0A0M3IQU1_ASCLU
MLGAVDWFVFSATFVVQGAIENGSHFYRLNESEWDLLNDRCGRNAAMDSTNRRYYKISFGSNALQGEFPWALKLFRFDGMLPNIDIQ